MIDEKVAKFLEQVGQDCILEIECPICAETIIAESDAADLYCDKCKRIVMQKPLTGLGLI